MNKKELLDRHFEIAKQFYNEILPRLDKLVDEDRITTGAAYYIYNVNRSYGYQQIDKILINATKSKNYTRYLKRTHLNSWQYYIDDMQKVLDKAIAFCDEQEALPFEQTQKQLLKASGELKGN